MPRAVMYTIAILLALLLLWAAIGHLDIVASAEGKLIPKTYLKLVQPADAGINDALVTGTSVHRIHRLPEELSMHSQQMRQRAM